MRHLALSRCLDFTSVAAGDAAVQSEAHQGLVDSDEKIAKEASMGFAGHTPGLDRLKAIHLRGDSLFHGVRGPGSARWLFPFLQPSTTDPDRVRGCWAPRLGLVEVIPLVRRVFASPIVATLMAMAQEDPFRGCATRLDEFSDGIVAITFGENRLVRGALTRTVRLAEPLDDDEPLPGYSVHVLPRSAFRQDRCGYPIPGQYVSPEKVPVVHRVKICAGDVRILAAILQDRERPWLERQQEALADPFTGPFREGGHLQFHSRTGELIPHRVPSPSDRTSALRQAEERGTAWRMMLSQHFAAAAEPLSTVQLGTPKTGPRLSSGRFH